MKTKNVFISLHIKKSNSSACSSEFTVKAFLLSSIFSASNISLLLLRLFFIENQSIHDSLLSQLNEVRNKLKTLRRGHYVVLHGMIGCGKSSLAAEALNHDIILDVFKVMWGTCDTC